MEKDNIKCPKCGHQIPLGEVLQHRLSEQVGAEVSKRVDAEKEKIETELKDRLEKEQTAGLKILKEKLDIESRKRLEAEKKELDFIRKQSEMEDKIKHQDLEIARKMQEERKLIQEKTQNEVEEKYNLQTAEMRKQLEDTKKALTEAQRKAQQGSMQTQGEVMELALEEILKANFSHDEIKPVPKGVNGADIVQIVHTPAGQECGSIVWESKQTKAWTEDWVQKLKDDGRNIKGSILVLVSEVLPKDMKNFGLYKGIWVTNFSSILGLTMALRNHLIAVASVITSETGKEEKMSQVYKYICSDHFSQKIQSTVETFDQMKRTIEIEKRAMTKIWAQRETQILRLNDNVAKMYGTIQGIAQLPDIDILELEAASEEPSITKNIDKNKKNDKTGDKNTTLDSGQTGLF